MFGLINGHRCDTRKFNIVLMVKKNMNFDAEAWVKGLKVFSRVENFETDDFMGKSSVEQSGRGLCISGPSRNGNHLLHSLLDNHPELPRIPGEDSVINEMFVRLDKDKSRALDSLKDPNKCCEFLLELSGRGEHNKWEKIYSRHFDTMSGSEELWSGMFYGKGKTNFVFDYQGTEVEVDYPTFAETFRNKVSAILNTSKPRLYDVYVEYMRSLSKLDPESKTRSTGLTRYDGITFGSGARGSLEWLLERGDYVTAIVPIRPFDILFSFAKGFYDTDEISKLMQEAWEHWHHKVSDYLRIKSAPIE